MTASLSELSAGLGSLVERFAPSVVRVDGRRHPPSTGIVWSPGVVVATSHSLDRDDALRVTLSDGVELGVTVVSRDPSTDLAVLRLERELGTPTSWSDLQGLKVGHLVLSLARPGRTIRASLGLVSALSAEPWKGPGGAQLERYLETDGPPRPGFSGGPLVDVEGRLLGLHTSGLLRGVALTIPTATVRTVVGQLLAHGRIRQGYLGVSGYPVRLPERLRASTGEETGLLLLAVEPGGPADTAGLMFGDTLIRLGSDELRTLDDLFAFLRADHVGESVPVRFVRAGSVQDGTLVIGARP